MGRPIRDQKQEIISLWERRVRETVPAAQKLSQLSLVDTVPELLDHLAEAIEQGVTPLHGIRRTSAIHGKERAAEPKFRFDELLEEYKVLRSILFDVLSAENSISIDQLQVLMEALDAALSQAARKFRIEKVSVFKQAAGAEDYSHATRKLPPEEEYFESQKRFRLMIDAVKDYAIFMLDTDGCIQSWNEGAKRIKGYSAEDVLGKHFSMFYTPEDRMKQHPQKELEITRKTGRYEEQGWRVRKDGTRFWANVVISSIFDSSGKIVGFTKVTRDLTEQMKAEKEIARLNEQLSKQLSERTNELQIILDTAGEGIFGVDEKGRFTFVNSATTQMLGWDSYELLGKDSHEAVHHSYPDGTPHPTSECEIYECLVDGKTHHSTKEVFWRKNGTSFPVEITSTPIRVGNDLRGLVIVFRDITQRRKSERDQRFLLEVGQTLSSTLDYKTALRTVAELVVPRMADWCIVDTVEQERLKRVAVVHRNPTKSELVREFERLEPDSSAPGGCALALRRGKTIVFPPEHGASAVELEELKKLGTSDPKQIKIILDLGLSAYVSVVMKARGQAVGVITFISTQPNFKFSAEEISVFEQIGRIAGLAIDNAKLFSQAQNAIRARDDMLAVVSHDLRNPLSAIGLNSRLVLKTAEKTDCHQQVKPGLDRIQRAALRMDQLIQDLLDIVRMEAGTLTIERHPERVDHLIDDTVELIEPLAQEKGISIEKEIAVNCCLVPCDHNRVLQVFSNLLGNAVKFTPEGGKVTVGARKRDRDVLFWVKDTGPGIRPEDYENVFVRYWQAGEAATKGVGLGLAISKGIVQAHGGQIWVESEHGKGATFYFTLPF